MSRRRTDLTHIHAQFPSIDLLEWNRLFTQDIDVYGRVWRDILKFDQAGEGRPGPRPALDPHVAWKRFMQLTEDDYCTLPFTEALRLLTGGAGHRAIATASGLERNAVYRLVRGRAPDLYEMEQIALAYGRRPAYFLEYRIGFVLKMMYAHMVKNPESSINPYKTLRDKMRRQD